MSLARAGDALARRLDNRRFGWRGTSDTRRASTRAESWESAGVVIVGGGVAGLAAGWRFLRAGFDDFVLLELEEAPGGTARSGSEHGVVPYPWGAHYLPAPMKENRALVSLLDEMGVLEGSDAEGEPVVGEQFICRDPEERVFYRGRWYEGLYLQAGRTEEDARQLRLFNAEVDAWAAWRDSRGRRAFAIPVASSSDDAEAAALDRISIAEWMRAKGFDSERLRWLVDYACRDDYGLGSEQASAWAGLFSCLALSQAGRGDAAAHHLPEVTAASSIIFMRRCARGATRPRRRRHTSFAVGE